MHQKGDILLFCPNAPTTPLTTHRLNFLEGVFNFPVDLYVQMYIMYTQSYFPPKPRSLLMPDTTDTPTLPLWAERDVTFKKLSPDQQRHVRQIVCPLYKQFVLDPQDPLERSCGVSVIHLIWSELLKQCSLASLSYTRENYSETPRGQQFDELFRLLNAKYQLSTLLIRLRQHPLKPSTPPDLAPSPFPIEAAILPPTAPAE